MPNAAIATSLTVIIAAGFVVIPMVMISSTLINEVIASGNLLSDAMQPGTWTTLAGQHPAFAPLIRWIMTHVDIYALIQGVTGLLGNWSASVLQGSVASVVNLLLTFYFLFYILRDHDQALAATERLSTLRPNEFTTLVERINSTVFATVYGTAVVAALQPGTVRSALSQPFVGDDALAPQIAAQGLLQALDAAPATGRAVFLDHQGHCIPW